MPAYNSSLQKATLREIPAEVHGRISKRSAELDGVSVTQVTFDAGARWSTDLKEYAGTDLCELPHVAYVINGTIAIQDKAGGTVEYSAGDAMLLPPGHDAWTVGDAACTFVEFSRGNDYYAA